jgi:LPPG:FO 2-phospho-L-lactate transferase
MTELGHEATCMGVADLYKDICDVFLIDDQDKGLIPSIADLGMEPVVAPILMETEEDKVALARLILELGGTPQNDGG